MNRRDWRSPVALRTGIGLLVGMLAASLLSAGIRGPGTYSGIVFYDRWDNCILFDGVFLMYISEAVKERLRSYQGQSVDIYAREVYQPVNPGDGLIGEFAFAGISAERAGAPPITGIEIKASRDPADQAAITLILEIRNGGLSTTTLASGSVGFAVLAHVSRKDFIFDPSDGSSYAVITRTGLATPTGRGGLRLNGHLETYGWRIEQADLLPSVLELGANQSVKTRLILDLPPGQYQFIAGYGQDVMSGPCIISNAVAFDVHRAQH